MKVISLVMQKGGVGKTSSAINLSACLAERGFRVLVLDMDPQSNTSSSFGVDILNCPTIYDVLAENLQIDQAIIETGVVNVHLIASNIVSAKLERDMPRMNGYEEQLSNVLKTSEAVQSYDFVIVDCPPALGPLSMNALVASDYCIIPVQPGIFTLEGVNSLLDTINAVNEEYNKPEILGMVLTFFDARTLMSHNMMQNLEATGMLFDTVIRVSQSIPRAQEKKIPVNIYDDDSRGSRDYKALTAEILRKLGME